jgi:hypothetical protein
MSRSMARGRLLLGLRGVAMAAVLLACAREGTAPRDPETPHAAPAPSDGGANQATREPSGKTHVVGVYVPTPDGGAALERSKPPCAPPQVEARGYCWHPCRRNADCPEGLVCSCEGKDCGGLRTHDAPHLCAAPR